jgi:hypothetical protein
MMAVGVIALVASPTGGRAAGVGDGDRDDGVGVMADCLVASAGRFGHDPRDLLSILATEGGRVGSEVVNSDGSIDYGPFQINSSGFPEIQTALGIASRGDVVRLVRDDFCSAAAIAGWWLARKVVLMGGDRRAGVGAYNSAAPGLLEAYLAKVDAHSRRLFGRPVGMAGLGGGTNGEIPYENVTRRER